MGIAKGPPVQGWHSSGGMGVRMPLGEGYNRFLNLLIGRVF